MIDRPTRATLGDFAIQFDATIRIGGHHVGHHDPLPVEVEPPGQVLQRIRELLIRGIDPLQVDGYVAVPVRWIRSAQAILHADHSARLERIPESLLIRLQCRIEIGVQGHIVADDLVLVFPGFSVALGPPLNVDVHVAVPPFQVIQHHSGFREFHVALEVIDSVREATVTDREVLADHIPGHLALVERVKAAPGLEPDGTDLAERTIPGKESLSRGQGSGRRQSVRRRQTQRVYFRAVLAVEILDLQVQRIGARLVILQVGRQHIDRPGALERRNVRRREAAGNLEPPRAPGTSQFAVAIAAGQLGRLDLKAITVVAGPRESEACLDRNRSDHLRLAAGDLAVAQLPLSKNDDGYLPALSGRGVQPQAADVPSPRIQIALYV